MATVKDNEPQLPASATTGTTQADPALAGPGPVPEGDAEAFARGQAQGGDLGALWRRKLAAWAEENPGQLIVAGLLVGFVAGKLLGRPRPRPDELE
ncbi:MAG: hypothetical protein NVSMB23_25730 [Myxococcales bacterium]